MRKRKMINENWILSRTVSKKRKRGMWPLNVLE